MPFARWDRRWHLCDDRECSRHRFGIGRINDRPSFAYQRALECNDRPALFEQFAGAIQGSSDLENVRALGHRKMSTHSENEIGGRFT